MNHIFLDELCNSVTRAVTIVNFELEQKSSSGRLKTAGTQNGELGAKQNKNESD